MANGIRTGDSCGFNKRRSSKFREGSRVRQTPEEGRRTCRLKRCGNNNKEAYSLKTRFIKKLQEFIFFDEISAAEFGSQKLSCSSEILFSNFFFDLRLSDDVFFRLAKVFVIFLFFESSYSFLICQLCYFHFLSFFHSSLWTWYILSQIQLLYPACICWLFESYFVNSLKPSVHKRWLIFCCDFLKMCNCHCTF